MTALEDGRTIDYDGVNTGGEAVRALIIGGVLPCLGIEQDDVGIKAFTDKATFGNFKGLRGQCSHATDGLFWGNAEAFGQRLKIFGMGAISAGVGIVLA